MFFLIYRHNSDVNKRIELNCFTFSRESQQFTREEASCLFAIIETVDFLDFSRKFAISPVLIEDLFHHAGKMWNVIKVNQT